MISESKNKAVKKPKKKEEKPEFGNEAICPNCGRTVFSIIWRCPLCGKVRCDRCGGHAGLRKCDCKATKDAGKTV
jgi:rubrerythrin